MGKNYYHMFANGSDAKDFITTESELKSAFNRFAICSYESSATVVSFSVEETHPHCLLWGTLESCQAFMKRYEYLSIKSIARNRGSALGVNLHCEIYLVDDDNYLMNVAAYTIVQATKDGKAVMPYDYRYGTGSLYFRSRYCVLPWLMDDDGNICTPVEIRNLSFRESRRLSISRVNLPGGWLVCNGFILPTNYVDVERFEKIFVTHNCFRAFLSSGKSKDEAIKMRMASVRGVNIEDLEARSLCRTMCQRLFGRDTTRTLSVSQRLTLAQNLKKEYRLSNRQIAFLTKLPSEEVSKYL